jgi:hypothetical protein
MVKRHQKQAIYTISDIKIWKVSFILGLMDIPGYILIDSDEEYEESGTALWLWRERCLWPSSTLKYPKWDKKEKLK